MTDEPQLKYRDARLVDCHDLDKFVNMHLEGYGRSWRALDTGSDGYHNGSYVEADVAFGEDIEDDLDQSFVRWLHCDGYFYEEEEGGRQLFLYPSRPASRSSVALQHGQDPGRQIRSEDVVVMAHPPTPCPKCGYPVPIGRSGCPGCGHPVNT